MSMTIDTLALTGHRPKQLGWGYDMSDRRWRITASTLKEFCKTHEVKRLISGMALGFDQLGAQVAIDLGIDLVAAVPFRGQEYAWPEHSRVRYDKILAQAEDVVIVSEGGYSGAKMQIRNEWMVDHADAVFALWNGKHSGTGNCVNYAKDHGVDVYTCSPADIEELARLS